MLPATLMTCTAFTKLSAIWQALPAKLPKGQILQAMPAKSSETKICQPLASKSTNTPILQAVSVELPDQSSRSKMGQTPSDQMHCEIGQTPSSEFHRIGFSRHCLENL